jgi:hypothetical protein
VLGMNPNTARVRLSRARTRLRGLLAGSGSLPVTGPQTPDGKHPEVPHAQP